jgi:alkylmercury lyase
VNDIDIERLLWKAFDRLPAGSPVTAADLTQNLDWPVADIAAALTAQAAIGRVELGDDGAVIGAHGVTLLTTPHTFTTGDATMHTWCALDAVGIPAANGDDASVTTSCGLCGASITVAIVGGEPTSGGHVVLWLPTAPCDNLRQQFCPHANLFCNRRHLDEWREKAGGPEGTALTLAETSEIGRSSWRRDADAWGAGIEAAPPTQIQETPGCNVRAVVKNASGWWHCSATMT